MIIETFTKIVASNRNKTAIVHGNAKVTFSELDEKSNSVANHLSDLGVKTEERIGVIFDPSINILVSILGILKSGCSYVPIDPHLPRQRIESTVRLAKTQKIITLNKFEKISDNIKTINLPLLPNSKNFTPKKIHPQQTAYVLFTSGTTGYPKGVCISHKSLGNYLKSFLQNFPKELGIIPLTSSVSFASGVTQLFSSLLQGSTLYIPKNDLKTDPIAFFNWYKKYPQQIFYCVPTVWENIIKYAEENWSARTQFAPRNIILSGEAPNKALINHTLKLWPQTAIWNLYGPTEAVSNLTYQKLSKNETPSIGQPFNGAKLFILDEQLNSVADGTPGELYASSSFLATNYNSNPSHTAASFIPNPFSKTPGERLYKTGDIAICLKGKIIFFKRIDNQVKIRGFRIELEEVENHLKNYPGILTAHAIAHEQSLVAAYSTSKKGPPINEKNLRTFLDKSLPHYMIPNIFVEVSSFPIFPNGKIDRKTLKMQLKELSKIEDNSTPASNPIEEALVQVWEKVFNYIPIGITYNFYALGGHSLLAAQIVQHLSSQHHLKITIEEILKNPTIESIAEYVKKIEPPPSIEDSFDHNERELSPLSYAQERIWFLQQVNPQSDAYTITISNEIFGSIEPKRLLIALNKCLEFNPILRCVPTEINGVCYQKILPTPISFPFEIIPCSWEEKEEILEKKVKKSFSMKGNLLCRGFLLQFSNDHFDLELIFHHMIFDEHSRNIFQEQLSDFYSTPTPSISPQNGFLQFASSQRKQSQIDLMRGIEYWKSKLENHSTLPLPYDFKKPQLFKGTGDTVTITLDSQIKKSLLALCENTQSTLFSIFLALYKITLSYWCNHKDICIGCAISERNYLSLENQIGFFANTIIFRTYCDKKQDFVTYLKQVKTTVHEALEYGSTPLTKIVQEVGHSGSSQTNPLFQVFLGIEYEKEAPLTLEGTKTSSLQLHNHCSKFDLSINILVKINEIKLDFEYSKELFKKKSIERFANYYLDFLNKILLNPKKFLCELIEKISDPVQTLQRLPLSQSLRSLFIREFESIAEIYPDSIAIIQNGENISYKILNEKANQLAHFLVKSGVQSETPVGICSDRSIDFIIGMLAIFKSRAVYVPIDPVNPKRRVDAMISGANLSISLISKKYTSLFSLNPQLKQILIFEEINNSNYPKTNLRISQHLSQLAYIMFTSGSSGGPKPVGIEHRSLINWLQWNQKSYKLQKNDKVLQKTSIGFDISLAELLPPLRIGATLVLASISFPKELDSLSNEIWTYNITVLNLVPSIFKSLGKYEQLLKESALRYIFLCGEPFYHSFYKSSKTDELLNIQVHNMYGPTEATIAVTSFYCPSKSQEENIPIGIPIVNTEIYTLDDSYVETPPNTIGELFIGGENLARGYLNMPRLTAEKFLPNPFGRPGSRLYSSGDLAKKTENGTLIYFGRNDQQIKIRGCRVELGDIESQFLTIDQVAEAIVVPRKEEVEIYYTLKSPISTKELRAKIKTKLPEYMIPSHFNKLEDFPRLSNGKIDRRATSNYSPAIANLTKKLENNLSNIEKSLLEIWKSSIKKVKISIHDNFFDIGGHSLLVVEILEKIQAFSTIPLKVLDFFNYPTIHMFSKYITEQDKATDNRQIKINKRMKQQKNAREERLKNRNTLTIRNE